MNESKYSVHIDDNYHYMGDTERRLGGVYDDCQAALARCKQIVDRSLHEHYEEGTPAISVIGIDDCGSRQQKV